MEDVVYQKMSTKESALDWRITRRVMADAVLMKTLHESQLSGEKHAVIAIVEKGELAEAYVSPETAVKKSFPFAPVLQAFDAYTTDRGCASSSSGTGRPSFRSTALSEGGKVV
jgi:hypothetical protein